MTTAFRRLAHSPPQIRIRPLNRFRPSRDPGKPLQLLHLPMKRNKALLEHHPGFAIRAVLVPSRAGLCVRAA